MLCDHWLPDLSQLAAEHGAKSPSAQLFKVCELKGENEVEPARRAPLPCGAADPGEPAGAVLTAADYYR